MKISSAFPSKYLKAADLPEGRELALAIARVQMEDMENSGDEKPVLYFEGKKKGLVLNVTNGNALGDAYGDDTDGWAGQPIILYGTTTSYQGRNVPCLRLKVPRGAAAATTGNAEGNPINDDEIPF